MSLKVTTHQLELLLDFLDQHRSLALGRVRGKEGNVLSTKLWTECSLILNADIGGINKTAKEWKKYYNQYKSRTKAKQRYIKSAKHRTGGGPHENIYLTPLEERLLGIIGGCSSPLPVRHNPLETLDAELAIATSNVSTSNSDQANKENIENQSNQLSNFEEISEFYVVPNEIDGISDIVLVEDASINNAEKINADKRGNETEQPHKRRRRRRRSLSPRVPTELELAQQRLATMEESRLQVDREMTQAIHRLASSMDDIASAIRSIATGYLLAARRRRRSARMSSGSSDNQEN